MSEKKLLFSVTSADFDIQTFCTGGKGGQNQNRKEKGVRLIHRASGARGEGREFREQIQNKQAAFRRLLETSEWKLWHRMEVLRRIGQVKNAESEVELSLTPSNLKIEVKDENGRWVDAATLVESPFKA